MTAARPAEGALPVVAWVWRYANGEEEVVFVDASTIDFDPAAEDVPTVVNTLASHAAAQARIDALTAELEAVKAKAARYDWLRNSERIPVGEGGDGEIIVCEGGGEDVLWGTELDAAIDAAMQARP